jgi:hypothetical protein
LTAELKEYPTYTDAGFDDEFADLVRQQARLSEAEDKIKTAKRAVGAQLLSLMQRKHVKSTVVDHFSIAYVAGKKGATKLDELKLFQTGKISLAEIAACKVTGEPGAPYVVVRDKNKPQKEHGPREPEEA